MRYRIFPASVGHPQSVFEELRGDHVSASVILKLEAFHPLPEEDKRLLDAVIGAGRTLKSGENIVREGDSRPTVDVMIEGLSYRHKTLPDGKRQIIGYLVPGDFCDLYAFLMKAQDHTITARTSCRVASLTEDHIQMLLSRPALARALGWSELVNGSILREWLVNIGRRSPTARVAHILCELLMRLQTVGLATADAFQLSLSQHELADTVGLTAVSVNRAFQRLRKLGLIEPTGRHIGIPDVNALTTFADFSPSYLHINRVLDE